MKPKDESAALEARIAHLEAELEKERSHRRAAMERGSRYLRATARADDAFRALLAHLDAEAASGRTVRPAELRHRVYATLESFHDDDEERDTDHDSGNLADDGE